MNRPSGGLAAREHSLEVTETNATVEAPLGGQRRPPRIQLRPSHSLEFALVRGTKSPRQPPTNRLKVES